MLNIEWNEQFEIGIPQIDAQHKALFNMVITLDEHLHQHAGAEDIANIIDTLLRYAAEHFTEEERLMLSFRYPELASHTKLHDQFISRLEEIQGDHNKGHQIADDIIDFIVNWLMTHILGADQNYNRFMNSGTVPASQSGAESCC